MGVQGKKSFSHGIKVKHAVQKKPALQKKPAAKLTSRTVSPPGDEVASPFPGFHRPTAAEVRALHSQLAWAFEERRPGGVRRADILGTVVGTILSQNTTNTNSHMAFTRLKKVLPTWDAVRKAKPEIVENAIRCGGLAPKKTLWIQHICKTAFEEVGKTSLEHLKKMSKSEVHAYLCRFTGVGKKTAAIINLFDVGHPDMAVDTHVFRYACQLGWIPSSEERATHNQKASREQRWPVVTRDTAYAHLDATFPDDLKYSMHLILTDTEGGLPVVCPARKELSFDGKQVRVDGEILQKFSA